MPTVRIRELFTNFSIRLEQDKIRMLNRSETRNGRSMRVYEIIFRVLELHFNYEIYLEYFNMKNEVKVYCQKENIDRVEVCLK